MTCIATFFSHFGAIRFKRCCDSLGYRAVLMPVPRNLSSSCGTCVRYEGSAACPGGSFSDEVEQAVEVLETGYRRFYQAEES